MQAEQHTQIAKLNDAYRQSSVIGCVLTSGILALNNNDEILEAVRHFNTFSESNDPYGEHDFGVINVNNHEIFWKIDYYNREYTYGLDPLDAVCNRVLTIMLASEY